MNEFALKFINEIRTPAQLTKGWNTLKGTRKLRFFNRIESAFVAWQAARLQHLSSERLWAAAMQDSRSFSEIRRARAKAPR